MPTANPLPDDPFPTLPADVRPPDRLTVSDARDLVALVPYRLGYRPEDSLVLVCLRGDAPRVGLVMRVDLPSADHLAAVVDHLARHAVRDGATAAVAVLYRHQTVPSTASDVVAEVLAGHGVHLRDSWHVDRHRFRSLSCANPACCPTDGWPVRDLDACVISAEMVARGCVVAGSRADLAGDLRMVDDARLERVGVLALEQAGRRPSRGAPLRTWRREALATWRSAAAAQVERDTRTGQGKDSREVPEVEAGCILGALTDPVVRDAVLLDSVPVAGSVADQVVSGRPGSRSEQAIRSLFSARAAVAPDQDRLDRAEAVLRSLARQSDGTMRAAPLGLLAWTAWWSGDGGRASVLVDLAMTADPGHRLALLLASALDAGFAPGWAQQDRVSEDHGEAV